ncbi:MAG TPA: DUF4080 domain-containing protein [Humisphaera sp.]|nr:DUF4080 domain-containing protein [Humisphaera sp.]
MPDIVLTTFNAKYAHASFGLRYLLANLGALRERATILEFEISHRSTDAAEAILALDPKIVGVGVYIWNAEQSERLVAELKRIRTDLIVIIGGPEVSYEVEQQPIAAAADFVVTGEADLEFAGLCRSILAGTPPLNKVIAAALPEFSSKTGLTIEHKRDVVALPYEFYDQQDIAHRVIYVEASRGCPFKCEFCLSSLDVPVRNVPLDAFLAAMQSLLDRGLTRFKFVDRTFNLNLNFSRSILEFFWERYRPGMFLHFEMIPDRLPEALREPIKRFPPGALQFEVGVQTFNEEVAARISRRQDNSKLADNLRFLREQTGVHVHADLIVGLPGEDLESFGRGFDRLLELGPQEIQVGILKRLRGTPIVRHDKEWGMVYSPHPPYEILRTAQMDFATLQRMRRFARYWDLIANSGNFPQASLLIWREQPSAFQSFLRLTDWLYARFGRNHAIAMNNLAEALFVYLTTEVRLDAQITAKALWSDYKQGGRPDCPMFLRPFIPEADRAFQRGRQMPDIPRRQARHLSGS